jgi:hypothetical protein
MSELSRLLLKAVRSLPQDEQDTLLEALLEPARLLPLPDPGASSLSLGFGGGATAVQRVHEHAPRIHERAPRVEFSLPPLGPETGGPWQSVPVRLSTDQHERLKQWCQANGFTMAVVLRGLVARFLDDQAVRRPRGPQAQPPDAAAGPPAGEPEAGPLSS